MNTPTSSPTQAPSPYPIYIKLILVALMWGGTFIAGRVVALELPAQLSACARFSVASVVLLALLIWKEGKPPRLSLKQVGITLALGLTGIYLYNLFFFSALALMPASRTSIFVAFNPILTALLAAVVLREALSWRKLLGICVAITGALVVITHGELISLFVDIATVFGEGEIFMILAVATWALYTVIGRQAMLGLSPLATTTYAALWGLLFLLLHTGLEFTSTPLPSFDSTLILATLYLGLLGTLLLDETLSPSTLIGGGLVLLGVTLTNRRH